MNAAPLAMLESAAHLEALLGWGKPVLLTFTGPKCVICRQLAPMLAAVVHEAGDALISAKADAEMLTDLADQYAIRTLPTTLLFRNGVLADRLTGFATAGILREWLAQHAVPLAPRW
ncbi:MAG: thioredoxin family protein [Burkholderiales bacterium]